MTQQEATYENTILDNERLRLEIALLTEKRELVAMKKQQITNQNVLLENKNQFYINTFLTKYQLHDLITEQ